MAHAPKAAPMAPIAPSGLLAQVHPRASTPTTKPDTSERARQLAMGQTKED